MMHLFFAVLNMSIAAVLLLGLVLVWRWGLRRFGAAGYRCLLWIPFLFRLLVPYSLPSALSVYNLFHRNLERPGGMLLSVTYLDTALTEQVISDGQPLWAKQFRIAACAVWAVGAAVVAAAFLVQYFRLRRALKGAYRIPEEETKKYRFQAGLRRAVPVLCTDCVKGPLVFGLFHPKVLLPRVFAQDSPGRGCILLHEMAHIRRRDHWLLMAGNLALALHWLNPLVWFARALMAKDIEQACDVQVLKKLEQDEQIEYAQTLVDWAGRRILPVTHEAFGEQDVVNRVQGVLNWKRLPRWAEILLTGAILVMFLCTATNPVLRNDVYLPVSSPFVTDSRRAAFQAAGRELAQALEGADVASLAAQASMDAEYFEPVYSVLSDLSLDVSGIRVYCNSASSAEVYLDVEVKDGAGLYQKGSGTLVAHLSQTEYREDPFVDCLMPQEKYEGIRLADSGSEASRLAVRLCANLDQAQFRADTLSPATVARVCMESAMEDKGESPPFSQERMEELAREYFALEDFFCDDPTVYDELHRVYQYEERPEPRMYVTETVSGANGEIRVVVEGYEDPLCLFPTRKLECNLTKAG